MYLKGWWSVAVWFLLPAWLIKTFNLYVNATWGSYHLHTCTWRKIINSGLMRQLWEFMGIVGKRVAEESLAWWEGSEGSGPTRNQPATGMTWCTNITSARGAYLNMHASTTQASHGDVFSSSKHQLWTQYPHASVRVVFYVLVLFLSTELSPCHKPLAFKKKHARDYYHSACEWCWPRVKPAIHTR